MKINRNSNYQRSGEPLNANTEPHIVPKPRFSLFRVSLTAAAAGILFGFDTAVINGALISLQKSFRLDEAGLEFAASSLLYGCLPGALAAGPLCDRWGRKPVLLVSAFVFFVSAIGAAIPHTLFTFSIARIVGGLGIGLASTVAPLYLAEVSPPDRRGQIVSLNQMAIVSGILLAYITNWTLGHTGPEPWRWMFASAAAPSGIFFIALMTVPESPRWLLSKGRETEALVAFREIGGEHFARMQLDVIGAKNLLLKRRPKPSFAKIRRPMLFAIVLAMLQQFTGINTVLYYGALVFERHGAPSGASGALAANVALGVTNFGFTLLALLVIDRIPRRWLLGSSAVLMALALFSLGFQLFQPQPTFAFIVLSAMLFVAAFATGFGPGVWVYISEIFPGAVRGRAVAVATSVLWASCILVSNTFLTAMRHLGAGGAFMLYCGICLFAACFVLFLPETRGRSLESIETAWVDAL